MSYIENNLLSGEDIILKAKIHWSVFIWPTFFIAVGLYYSKQYTGWSIGSLLFGMVLMASAIDYFHTTELAVTNKRIIAKIGFINRTTVELMHNKVESLNFNQSVLGRILNYGTIFVNGTGGKSAPVKRIAAPLILRRTALELIDKSH